jgi:tetratricopeptide (TPR) repeat protein
VNVAYSLNNIGVSLRRLGDAQGALARYHEGLELFRQLGEQWGIAAALNNIGLVARIQGDYAKAVALYRESLWLWREMGDKQGIIESLEEWADLAVNVGDPVRATRLYSAAHASRLARRLPLTTADQETHVPLLADARAAIGEVAFEQAWAEGQSMSMVEAIDYALAQQPESFGARDRPCTPAHAS